MAERHIEGVPYSASFLDVPQPPEDTTEASMAYAIVQPPFDFQRAAMMIDGETCGEMEIQEYATTISSTVLLFTVEYHDGRFHTSTNERRLGSAFRTLQGIVETLNLIESGEFKQEYKG